jgi:hypothetical protein
MSHREFVSDQSQVRYEDWVTVNVYELLQTSSGGSPEIHRDQPSLLNEITNLEGRKNYTMQK